MSDSTSGAGGASSRLLGASRLAPELHVDAVLLAHHGPGRALEVAVADGVRRPDDGEQRGGTSQVVGGVVFVAHCSSSGGPLPFRSSFGVCGRTAAHRT